jgi:hypothetical protein
MYFFNNQNFFSLLRDDYLPVRILSIFNVILWTWLFANTVTSIFRNYAARKITIRKTRPPEIEIETVRRRNSSITTDQIREIRKGGQTIFVKFRSRSPFRDLFLHCYNMHILMIARRQFSDRGSWDEFVESLDPFILPETPVATSDYPPTYPVVPCPNCGLTIPEYEPHCTHCATPRRDPAKTD